MTEPLLFERRRRFVLLLSTFVVRELKPLHENIAKSPVRSSWVFIADSIAARCGPAPIR